MRGVSGGSFFSLDLVIPSNDNLPVPKGPIGPRFVGMERGMATGMQKSRSVSIYCD